MSQADRLKAELINCADSAAKEEFIALLAAYTERLRYEEWVDATSQVNDTLIAAKSSHVLTLVVTAADLKVEAVANN